MYISFTNVSPIWSKQVSFWVSSFWFSILLN